MEENLKKALEETSLPYYYLKYPQDGDDNCIVYKYVETPVGFIDDDENAIEYRLYFNLYCTSGLNKKKEILKECLKKYGFLKSSIPQAIFDEETNVINQPLIYNYHESFGD